MSDINTIAKVPLPRVVGNLPQRTAEDYAPPERREMLNALANELSRKPLDEIAARLTKLTWGEMEELAKGIKCATSQDIWDWSTAREGLASVNEPGGFEELALSAFAAAAGIAAVVTLLALVLAVAGCSADYLREKPVVTDLHRYCLSNPKDSACGEDHK